MRWSHLRLAGLLFLPFFISIDVITQEVKCPFLSFYPYLLKEISVFDLKISPQLRDEGVAKVKEIFCRLSFMLFFSLGYCYVILIKINGEITVLLKFVFSIVLLTY